MTRSGDLLSTGTEADLGTVLCSADAPFMRTESLVCLGRASGAAPHNGLFPQRLGHHPWAFDWHR